MSQIFQNYLDTAFGEHKQSDPKIKQFQKNYARFFPKDKNAVMLDIGPGRGEMLTCFTNNQYTNIKGIDISSSIVDFCEKLNFNCELVTNTKEYLDNHKNTYDFISMCDVLEHIPKSETIDLLTSVKNALKPEGVVIFQVPNMQSPDAPLYMFYDFTHEVGYTEHSLRQVLQTCGFTNIECHGFEYLNDSIKSKIHAMIRSIYWASVFIKRKINGNLPHKILHPVFYAVVKK